MSSDESMELDNDEDFVPSSTTAAIAAATTSTTTLATELMAAQQRKRREKAESNQKLERLMDAVSRPMATQDLMNAFDGFASAPTKNEPKDSLDVVFAAIRGDDPNDESRVKICKLLRGKCFPLTSAEIQGESGDYPIHTASGLDRVLLMQYLETMYLDREAPYWMTNDDGDTPLHVACRTGSMKAMEYIVDALGGKKSPDVVKLLRQRNKERLTSYDVAADTYLNQPKRKPNESVVEYRLRCAKDGQKRGVRKEQVQKFILAIDSYFMPTVYYHPDCLDHLAPKMPMQQQREAGENGEASGEPAAGNANPAPPNKFPKTRRGKSNPSDAWESPDRLTAIMSQLKRLCDDGRIKIDSNFECADKAELERVHSSEYVAFVQNLAIELANTRDVVPFTPRVQSVMQKLDHKQLKSGDMCDTGFSEGTLRSALRAAGSVNAAIDSVLKDETRRTFCVVRPPGHHAGRDGLLDQATSCGFCLFNNVMIGAMHAMEERPDLIKKVAIVDIDVHHGNGTEEIIRLYHDSLPAGAEPKVLFLSTHLHDRAGGDAKPGSSDSTSSSSSHDENMDESTALYEFYPGSGDVNDVPHNAFNVPLKPLWRRKTIPSQAVITPLGTKPPPMNWVEKYYLEHWGRSEFRRVVEERVLPPLRAFHPDLIIVSAGFDAGNRDLGNCRFFHKAMGGLNLEREDFHWIAHELSSIAEICCKGRMVSVLEGGYGKMNETTSKIDRSILARNVDAYIEALCGASLTLINPQEDDTDVDSDAFVDPFLDKKFEPDAVNNAACEYMNTDEDIIEERSRRSQRKRKYQRKAGVDAAFPTLSAAIAAATQTRSVAASTSAGPSWQRQQQEKEQQQREKQQQEKMRHQKEKQRAAAAAAVEVVAETAAIAEKTRAEASRKRRDASVQENDDDEPFPAKRKRTRSSAAAAPFVPSTTNINSNFDVEAVGGGNANNSSSDFTDESEESPVRDIPSDVMIYLKRVRAMYNQDGNTVYQRFLITMSGFKSKEISIEGVIDRVKYLFRGEPQLILDFNPFLPKNIRIQESDLTPEEMGTVPRTESSKLEGDEDDEEEAAEAVPVGREQAASPPLDLSLADQEDNEVIDIFESPPSGEVTLPDSPPLGNGGHRA